MRALLLVALLGAIGLTIGLAILLPGRPAPAKSAPAAGEPAREEPPSPPAPPIPFTGPEYAGSDSCAECHPDIHARWTKTGHALTIRPFSADVVRKPFDGDVFVSRDIDHHMGPGAQMTCEGPGGKLTTFPVELVIGLRRIQMFTTHVGGRIQVLPVFLEVPPQRWFDYTDFIFGGPTQLAVPPDSAYSWYGPHRNFSSRCGRCHMVDYAIGYDPDAGTYDTTYAEGVVACEACHGPAGRHVHLKRTGQKGEDPIVNPVRLPHAQADMICGQCHAESYMVAAGFRPGDDLFARYEVSGLEDQRHTHPDGRARELLHALVQTMESRCGPMTCTKCHDPHGSGSPGDLYKRVDDDTMCTQCHADVKEHSHHQPDSPGSRCVNCHMPRLVIEAGHGRVYDHTISIPSIRNTQRWGLPNACRSCHLTEQTGFEYEPFAQWYPGAEERNHRVALADAVGAARAGKAEAKELLLPLLEDANPIYRAAAASYLAPFDVDLRPQLADPHLRVRLAAIEGVARRTPEALEPLLDDPAPVLRRSAAMALASRRIRTPFDYMAGHPDLRAKVIAALEACVEWRPDDADLHGTLAPLYEQAGRQADADRARARYQLLRPWQH